MYVYSAVKNSGAPVTVRFLTLRGARCFADSMLLKVREYSIEKCGLKDGKLPVLIVLALALALSFPVAALADDSSASAASGSSASAESYEPAQSSEIVQAHDYSNVVNEQVVGDFFFVLCADSVLLVLILGALGFLAFRPAR